MKFTDGKAIFLQIADYIGENILTETWKPGDKIPSVRDLAVNIEVNPNTVARAYQYLQENEIINLKRGVGLFISDNAKQIVSGLRKKEFVDKELPGVFNTMKLLEITIDDLKKLQKNMGEK